MSDVFEKLTENVLRAEVPLPRGALGSFLDGFGAEVVVGHPTFRNADNIGAEVGRGVAAAAKVYASRRVAFAVSDGTYRLDDPDGSTLAAAARGAAEALAALGEGARRSIAVTLLAYDGYGGDRTAGKGSALKLLFDEMEACSSLKKLVLLDGDLRNDLEPWFRVFLRVEEEHRKRARGREFFVTARYARHFVDASLTRFVVGPLTTLMGQYVPGGISGDIVLSAGAAARERAAAWDEHRRRYGTDIATTFDNIADENTDVYEVYLGAKLHDITDEAKLSVMPGEVIGAALGRILHYEKLDGRVTRLLAEDGPCKRPVVWGPEKTGIDFIDPGYTGVFDVDAKRSTLLTKFSAHADAMEKVLPPEAFARVREARDRLRGLPAGDGDDLRFLGLTRELWVEILYRSVAYLLREQDPETAKSCLNYLYTAAFLELCREKMLSLGAQTYGEARKLQKRLGVPPHRAKEFYEGEVDGVVERMALDFFRGRRRILDLLGAAGR